MTPVAGGGRLVPIRAEIVGVDTGLWCRTCARSSGVAVHFAYRQVGARRLVLATVVRCRDCRANLPLDTARG